MRPVIVIGIPSDEGKVILVVVCTDPNAAYASINQKHWGFIRDGKFILSSEKDAPTAPSKHEEARLLQAFFALKGALHNLATIDHC